MQYRSRMFIGFLCVLISFLLFFFDQLAEAAGSSLVSIIVDHIFLCIKDAGMYQLWKTSNMLCLLFYSDFKPFCQQSFSLNF